MSDHLAAGTRARIVEHADRLFYESGYSGTSFSMVAAEVGISKGNFHHHFKAKDEILAEVVRRRRLTTAAMLDEWEGSAPTPEGRLRCFVEMVRNNRVDIMRYGCPVGSLCAELAKDGHDQLADVRALLEQFAEWLTDRFGELGLGPGAAAAATHLLVLSQGVALVTNVSKDDALLDREVDAMHAWLDGVIADLASPSSPHPT